ncbi:MAG: hypothetical protein ACK504_08560 [Bacteroidota bacterium]
MKKILSTITLCLFVFKTFTQTVIPVPVRPGIPSPVPTGSLVYVSKLTNDYVARTATPPPANCVATSTTFVTKYGKLQTYIPTTTVVGTTTVPTTPIKTIKIAFHFFKNQMVVICGKIMPSLLQK